MPTSTKTVWHSWCEQPCGQPITAPTNPGGQVTGWTHDDEAITDHPAVSEVRACVDATCPDCGNWDTSYSFGREVFCCSRCGWTGTERPA